MSTISGNLSSQAETRRLLCSPGNLVLSGPDYVGKRSFVCSLLEDSIGHQDILVAPTGPDGAREARDFLACLPALGAYRAVVVDEADRLSEAAQDSWLKLVEETPPSSTIVFVGSDVELLRPALRSRLGLGRVVRWGRLSSDEVCQYVASTGAEPDPAAVASCRGLPGLYDVVRSPAFPSLRSAVLSHIDGSSDPLFSPIPEAVKELKGGRSPERDAVSLVCRCAALERVGDLSVRAGVRSFLEYAALLVRVPSVSADIYWQRACLWRR